MTPLPETETPYSEGSPLLSAHPNRHVTHLSMEAYELSPLYKSNKKSQPTDPTKTDQGSKPSRCLILLIFVALLSSFAIKSGIAVIESKTKLNRVISRAEAEEQLLDIGEGLQIWFQTWGNVDSGIPVMFVHGGPGQAIQDYPDNGRFFDENEFFVVEIDQRGTGKSQPSVRDGWENMKYYANINKDVMVEDFERVREYLSIDKWLVFGGSWGSTLSILYAEKFPSRCISLIIRGIYLDTRAENIGLYSQATYERNPKRMKDFGIFFDYAKERDPLLDPYDAHAIMSTYGYMIMSGDSHAIWQWYVFEYNLMEFDPNALLDPNVIEPDEFSTALSVAFFESRLWLYSSFEEQPPKDLLAPNMIRKMNMPIWICQGIYDEVCPDKYAHHLVDAIEKTGSTQQLTARFLEATHEDSDPVMEQCLKLSMQEFVEYHDTGSLLSGR